MITDELKQTSQVYHTRLEGSLNFMKPDMTLEEYKAILSRLWGLYAPMERQIGAIEQINALVGFEDRRKQQWLEQDLRALGVDPDSLPEYEGFAAISTTPQALGCMYVLEGSTLGGQFIAKHIKTQLGLDESNGCTFFNGYAQQTGPMWKAFSQALNDYPLADGQDKEQLLETAIATFIAFETWFTESKIFSQAAKA
jgi:heme oxygenase